MTLTTKMLCEALRSRASLIHDLVTFSYSISTLGVSEETITEIALLELQRSLSPYLITTKFNKHEEASLSGADWLWCIGRPGRWFSLLVQAKLARPGRGTIRGLHHGNGQQLAQLVSHAKKMGCFPLYAVYSNHPPSSSRHSCGLLASDPKQMGSVLVRTSNVAEMYRRSRNRSNVQDLLSKSVPWACLFGCADGTAPSQEFADVVAEAITLLSVRDESEVRPYVMERALDIRLRPNKQRETPLRPGEGENGALETSADAPEIVEMRHRKEKREWLPGEPDDCLEAPQSLISTRPPEIVDAILRGDRVLSREVGMVSIISSEPLPVQRTRR